MSEENGNVLKLKIDQLIEWKNGIGKFIDETKVTNKFCKDYKSEIMELNVMKRSIDNIEAKLDKQEANRRQLIYWVAGAILASVVTPILARFL